MSERTLTGRPSAPRMVSRRLLQQFGVHPKDRDAVALDMRGTSALCVATNHGVLEADIEFLPKPFTRSGLLTRVRDLLAPPER